MKILSHLSETCTLPQRIAATIGNFDGVHLGHQSLIKQLCIRAALIDCSSLVILFEPQPSEYLLEGSAPSRLMSLRKKLQALQALGVHYVFCVKFNEYIAHMDATKFAEDVIFDKLHVKYLLTGEDFRFGRARKGDIELLTRIGKKYDAIVETAPDFLHNNERVSSTRIRAELQQGHLSRAANYLGRPYALCGRVVKGDGRGRQWGIPTANILLRQKVVPLSGVFTVTVTRRNINEIYYGVANIGYRPTINGQQQLSLEVHLFNFNESIYGEMLDITFNHKIRDEQKFSSINELINQIRQDIATAQDMLSSTITI